MSVNCLVLLAITSRHTAVIQFVQRIVSIALIIVMMMTCAAAAAALAIDHSARARIIDR